MKYYIGVDGGGTKTKFVVCDSFGNVINQIVVGTSNPNDIGVNNLIELLKETIDVVLPEDAESFDISLGLSGLSYSGAKEKVEASLKEIPLVNNVYLESDIRIALDACYPNRDGAISIIGTGNVVYIRKDGEYTLLGGAGYMFDHSLSAYDLGEKAISAVIKDIENRGPETKLTKLILNDHPDIKEVVRESYKQGKSYVASFAHYVTDIYREDKVATVIIKECVSNFEYLINAALYYVEEVSLAGGLAKIWNSTFAEFFGYEDEVKVAENDPIVGAFVRFDVYNEEFKNKLVESL